ncbi:FERM domain-containing protein 3 [Clonorchis sinensis]|uniref:FERM domain-containing protein 3 n=1 Tax=Clonorchis sinensis TaxID=79923 RepID=A0A8T1M7N6_CLOSI|nr:FERM domain-containing protein 3 [Clonorchis sinensis]
MNPKLKDHRHIHTSDCFAVTVRLLEDDTISEVDVPEDATGKWLFEEVCRRQDVMEEREYFGLRYLEHDLLSSPTKQWIDLTRSLFVQLKNTHPRTVSFRIKHYPADPFADLKLAKTHYLLYRQLRRDLASGRLVSGVDEMVRLAALIVQVELGDSSVQDLPQLSAKSDVERSYLSDFHVLHNQTQRMERLVLEEHQKLEGLLPSEAATELIQLASSLETYGVDPIRVKTKAYGSRPIHIGLTHRGVSEFVSNRCQKIYLWPNISWMTCDGKHFILAYSKQICGKKKKAVEMVSFKCETKAVAHALWEWATDRQLFLTLEKSSSVKPVKSKRGLFSRKHTFTFAGRCRREVLARPTLAATLPSDISKSHLEHVENFCADKIQSAGAHSISMVALTQDVVAPGRAMQVIGEVESGERTDFAGAASMSVSDNLVLTRTANAQETSKDQTGTLLSMTATTLPNNFEDAAFVQQHLADVLPLPRTVPSELLAPLFKELPRRRYTHEAKIRQHKLLQIQKRHLSGEERNAEIFDTDEDETEAIAELDAITEAADHGWMKKTESATQNPVQNSSPGSFFSRFFSTPSKASSTSKPVDASSSQHQNRSGTSSSIYHSAASMTSQEHEEEGEEPVPASAWSIMLTSAGILTGLSLVGLALILETEVHSPLMVAFREHPWILDFDARYYRPFRTALFGFWRR